VCVGHDVGHLVLTLDDYTLDVAGPVSLSTGVVLAALLAIVMARRRRSSHDAPIRMLRDAGLWLLATSFYVVPRPWVFVPGIVAGPALVGVALLWLLLRMRFVAGLRAAAQAQARPAPPVSHDGAQPYLNEGLLPYRLGGKDAAYELLVWNPPPSDSGAY